VDIREIASLMSAQPFTPFAVRMADGREFMVNHPDFIARSPTGRSVIVFDASAVHILDARLIARLRHPEPLTQTE
jgi:hypothetical protein